MATMTTKVLLKLSTILYRILEKKGILMNSSNNTTKQAVLDNWGKGYDALRAIIVPLHPLIFEQPLVLV